jgi:DNA-binding NarL/FixJ family response regulator
VDAQLAGIARSSRRSSADEVTDVGNSPAASDDNSGGQETSRATARNVSVTGPTQERAIMPSALGPVTTIAIVSPVRVYQELLASAIGAMGGFAVLAVASEGAQATQHLAEQHPEAVVVDAAVPDLVTLIDAAMTESVHVILFGTASRPSSTVPDGCDVLPLSASTSDVVNCLLKLRRRYTLGPPPSSALDCLTAREREIVALISQGFSNKEIAAALTISIPTVKSHVHNVLGKIGAERRTEASRLLGPGVGSPALAPIEDAQP